MPGVLSQALEYLGQGGWIMIPLIASSVVMWMLIVERSRTYRGLAAGDIRIDEAVAAVRTGEAPAAGPGLRSLLVRDFLAQRAGDPELDRDILRHSAMVVRVRLRDHLSAIAVLSAVAPLLGLLGTVLGMIETFDVISVFGTGNAKAMAGGISVALVTTQSGLIIAIPGLFLSGTLSRRARNLENQLDEITIILSRHVARLRAGEARAS
jgi:biopolymer transport protein ExbB